MLNYFLNNNNNNNNKKYQKKIENVEKICKSTNAVVMSFNSNFLMRSASYSLSEFSQSATILRYLILKNYDAKHFSIDLNNGKHFHILLNYVKHCFIELIVNKKL